MFCRKLRLNPRYQRLFCITIIFACLILFLLTRRIRWPSTPSSSSSSSSSLSSCKIPATDHFAPELLRYFRPLPRVVCGAEDWVYVFGGRLWFRAALAERHPDFRCRLRKIRRMNDFRVKLGPEVDFENGTRMSADSVFVACEDKKEKTFKSIFASISLNPDKLTLLSQKLVSPPARLLPRPPPGYSAIASPSQTPGALTRPPHILILGEDSMSRGAWFRHLPKTVQFFERNLKGIVLKGYNIVGDGTPAALLPLLTGHTEYELPEARRGKPRAKVVDGHPWIWRSFAERGYMTSFVEDAPDMGTFHLRMIGFRHQPTDVYGRNHYLARDKWKDLVDSNNTKCDGEMHRYKAGMLNLAREHLRILPQIPKFAFFFQSEFTHDNNNEATTMDDDIFEFLVDARDEGHLDNTVLILMSDHGARFASHRASEIGKLEERKPYFGFSFPTWFRQQHPQKLRNFAVNAEQSLVTPFDVHATLLHLLDLRAEKLERPHPKKGRPTRAFSLFQIIGDRSCVDADVRPHWCACLQWRSLTTNDSIVATLAERAVEFLNSLTEGVSEDCVEWTRPRVTFAAESKTTDELRRFKKSKSWFVPDLTADTNSTIALYQIRLLVSPSEGALTDEAVFEMSIESLEGKWKFSEGSTSRLNRYGRQSDCIAKKFPHLRKFCYCKKR